jgi:hypothetical protein
VATVVSTAAEARLTELALQVMDAARAILHEDPAYKPNMAAELLEAGALSLAIQSVFLAELMESRDDKGDARPSPERFRARYLALGGGVGNCVAAVEGVGQVVAVDLVMQGMAGTMADRATTGLRYPPKG